MTEPHWLSNEEMRLWRAFLAVSISVVHNIETDLKDQSGLSLDDYEVLVHLSESPELRLSFNDLSDRLHNPQSFLSQRIDRMAKRGLVALEEVGPEQAETEVVLTKMGHKTIVKAAPDHLVSVRKHAVDHLHPDEVGIATEILTRIEKASKTH